MEDQSINTFKEMPRTNLAWRAVALGVSAIVIFPVLGILASAMRRWLDPASVNPNRSIMEETGFLGAVFSLLLAISALAAGIKAFKQGERSWVVWVSFVLPFLVAAFWVFMIVGEFVSPH